jgi:hypothetical protein
MSSKNLLVILAHSRKLAVRLFGKFLKETALPQIDTNLRRSPGAARGIVVYDHPNKEFAVHSRAFA